MKYDVLIVGAGPGGIFAAYELMNNDPEKKIAVFEAGQNMCDHERIWRCRRFLRWKI